MLTVRKPNLRMFRSRCSALSRLGALFAALSVVLAAAGGQAALAAGTYSVWLEANPDALVADGRSETTISAEVRDSSGRAVADGTTVEFTTSQGVIERTAHTSAGVARVRLQSDVNVGCALVSAVVASGNAVAQLRVDFLEPGTEIFDESFILVSSDHYLGYDVGGKTIDAAGGVEIHHRGLDITADEAQIDVKRTVIRARARIGGENIIIRRGDKELAASALYYDFTSMKGVFLLPVEQGARRMAFRGRDLFVEEDSQPRKTETFDFVPVSQAEMFIKSRSLVIRPGEEIKFKRADFYMAGDKVLSVPLHVERLRGSGGVDDMVTYSTDGLRLNIPIYYSLTPNGTGAVRIRHAQSGGWGYYTNRSGWQVDIEQEYNFGSSREGAFALNHVTSRDWGARWYQRSEFDNNSQLYTYLHYPSHRNIYGSVDYRRVFDDYTFSMNIRGSGIKNAANTYSTTAYVRTRSRPLANGAVSYGLSSRLFYNTYAASGGDGVGGGLGLNLFGKPIRFGRGTTLNTSLSVTSDWGGPQPGTSLNAYAGFYHSLGSKGQFSLNYSYSRADTSYGCSAQRLSSFISFAPSSRLSTHLNATYGLDDGSLSAFGELSLAVAPGWRLHLLGTHQRYSGYTYGDIEIAAARAVGKQEARLVWSQELQRFRVELSALSLAF